MVKNAKKSLKDSSFPKIFYQHEYVVNARQPAQESSRQPRENMQGNGIFNRDLRPILSNRGKVHERFTAAIRNK